MFKDEASIEPEGLLIGAGGVEFKDEVKIGTEGLWIEAVGG